MKATKEKAAEDILLDIDHLRKEFPIRGGVFSTIKGEVKAVDDISFFVRKGETLCIVGESGCGKTTVARLIMMLTTPTEGYVFFEAPKDIVSDFRELHRIKTLMKKGEISDGDAIRMAEIVDRMLNCPSCRIKEDRKRQLCNDARNVSQALSKGKSDLQVSSKAQSIYDIADEAIEEIAEEYCINYMSKRSVRKIRGRMQMVFQDPLSALDPRMTIKNTVGEPLAVYKLARGEELTRKVVELLEVVGLKKEHLNRFPHEFSGGQRQRINMARALALRPTLLVLDEPTSALDVSVQAQVLNLIMELQKSLGLTYMFITHDLSVVFHISDRVAVMYAGKLVELARTETLFTRMAHPYTFGLLSAVPIADPSLKRERRMLSGEVPSPSNPPSGCRFHPRCWKATEKCSSAEPDFREIEPEHYVACHFPLTEDRGR